MNQIELLTKRNNIARLFRQSSKIHRNYIKLNPNNSKEHEMKKVEICWELLKANKSFLTEAEFENGKKCDVVCLDDAIVWEVLHSETPESIENKRKNYPLEIKTVKTVNIV